MMSNNSTLKLLKHSQKVAALYFKSNFETCFEAPWESGSNESFQIQKPCGFYMMPDLKVFFFGQFLRIDLSIRAFGNLWYPKSGNMYKLKIKSIILTLMSLSNGKMLFFLGL